MDWDSAYNAKFKQNLKYLQFEPRSVRLFELQGSYGTSAPLSSLNTRDLKVDGDLSRWLDEQAKTPKALGWPDWSLTILAPRRAPKNIFEQRGESSGTSLVDVGLSETNFVRLVRDFKIAKSFLHTLESNQSLYSFQHPETGADGYPFLSFNIRTTPVMLGDKAMTVRYNADRASTFVLLQGCLQGDLEKIHHYLYTMQRYGGHPLLMVALFLEMSQRQLSKYYNDLRSTYIVLFQTTFARQDQELHEYNRELQQASRLYESHLTEEAELAALQLRLTSFIKSLKFVTDASRLPKKQKDYMSYYGGRMLDRLQILTSELEYLQTKCANQREGLQLLISSMDSIVALSESKISQQISVASKRDSTVMMALAVGTMLFLPLTAMASIFAMPFLPWNVNAGDNVNGYPLLIYLTLSLPLTALTLILLIAWMWAVDYEAKTSHVTLRPAAKEVLAKLAKPFGSDNASRTNTGSQSPPTPTKHSV